LEFSPSEPAYHPHLRWNTFALRNHCLSLPLSPFKTQGFTNARQSTRPNLRRA